jgi:SagB-type dehydrogenase family enzyme
VVSEFATVSWHTARVEITSTISGAKFATDNFDLIRVLHAFAEPKTVQEVIREFNAYEPEQIARCIDELIEAEVLITASAGEPGRQHYWDRNALAFHWSSRRPSYHINPVHASAAIATPRSPNTISLVCGSAEKGRDLIDVLDARRSWRTWPKMPICFEAFSRFLWLSARNRAIPQEETKDNYVSRPYPSGGAAYSLELYPVIAPEAVESITAGLYRYIPEIHVLEKISEKSADYLPFLESAGRSAGTSAAPIVFVITSHFAKQSEMYGHLAYSLLLKEVGCLFQTFYLVGEYLGFAPCALGGGTPIGLLARLCNTTELAEPVIGEFIIGPRL